MAALTYIFRSVGVTAALFVVLLALPVSVLAASPLTTQASAAKNVACDTLSQANPEGGTPYCTNPGGTNVNKLLTVGLNILSLVAGAIAIIMLMVSGLKYVTSQGDAASVTSSKNTLLYAIVGLIVVAFAQILVKFVLGKAT